MAAAPFLERKEAPGQRFSAFQYKLGWRNGPERSIMLTVVPQGRWDI